MRRIICALLLLCMLAVSAQAAEISGISVMSLRQQEQGAKAFVEVRALDKDGSGIRLDAGSFSFLGSERQIPLRAEPLGESFRGHIVVVDLSQYYYGVTKISHDTIRAMVDTCLSGLQSNERVKFVLATESEQPTVTEFMTVDQARTYASGLMLSNSNSANINQAIQKAFEIADSASGNDPYIDTVFIIADPDLDSNQNKELNLSEVAFKHTQSSKVFDVLVAVPYREQFLKATTFENRRKGIENGVSTYRTFAGNCGGVFVSIPQSDSGIVTMELEKAVSKLSGTSYCFEVDLTGLSGKIPKEPSPQTQPLIIGCGQAMVVVGVEVDTSSFAEMETPVPQQTPTPAPTPVVIYEQSGPEAIKLIRALKEMYYLPNESYNSVNEDVWEAYLTYCDQNGLTVSNEGIYEDVYGLIISGVGVKVTPEPTPTPTPRPAVIFGQSDIAAVRVIKALKAMYYLPAESNYESFNTTVLEAYLEYCRNNDLEENDSGVSDEVFAMIVNHEGMPKPTATPEPKATPTPTPAPTPVVALGQNNAAAVRVITALKALYYLPEGSYDSFNTTVWEAYSEYCTMNGLEISEDGIDSEIYRMIVNKEGVLKPTPTPSPTPEPTPVVVYNQSDMAASRVINGLKAMNYLPADSTYDSFNSTVWEAYTEYCRMNGLESDDSGLNEDVYAMIVNREGVPKPTPKPTATPVPTPAVVIGQTDAAAVRVISALKAMYYLPEGNYDSFNSTVWEAYLEYCRENGLKESENGISSEAYSMLVNKEGTVKTTPTPSPSPTPEPTIVPGGYHLNDTDVNLGGSYIEQMQTALKALNCYDSATPVKMGSVDQATLDAVKRYCEHYHWDNDVANGISAVICRQIIADGADPKPIETPKPSASDKLKTFMTSNVALFDTSIPNWAIAAVCAVLFIIIVLFVILRKPDNDEKDDDYRPESKTKDTKRKKSEKSTPVEREKKIHAEISFAGDRYQKEFVLKDGQPYMIKRQSKDAVEQDNELLLNAQDKTVSRSAHAELLYHKGFVYLSDKSEYHTVWLKGQTVYDRSTQDGVIVNAGDEMKIGEHIIVLKW